MVSALEKRVSVMLLWQICLRPVRQESLEEIRNMIRDLRAHMGIPLS